MSEHALIEAVRRGERIKTQHSIHDAEKQPATLCRHRWRTIACDMHDDVCECRDCGKQHIFSCTFDDEMS